MNVNHMFWFHDWYSKDTSIRKKSANIEMVCVPCEEEQVLWDGVSENSRSPLITKLLNSDRISCKMVTYKFFFY